MMYYWLIEERGTDIFETKLNAESLEEAVTISNKQYNRIAKHNRKVIDVFAVAYAGERDGGGIDYETTAEYIEIEE